MVKKQKIYLFGVVAIAIFFIMTLLLNLHLSKIKNIPKFQNQAITTKRQTLIPLDNKIYFGAFANFGFTEDDVTKEKIEEFEKLVGKKIAWAYFSNNWFGDISFPTETVALLREMDITPYIRLMPRQNFSNNPYDHEYTLEKISNGEFDTELYDWAVEAKESDVPIMIEFGTEVNGNWFPWNGEKNGQDTPDGYGDPLIPDGPEKFIDAYRHVIEIFRQAGVDNITWVYHINAVSEPQKNWNELFSYYPGDSYIDWIGVSVYGAQNEPEQWISFENVFHNAYKETTNKTNKPILIAEFAVHESQDLSKKSMWLDEVFDALLTNRYPKVKGVAYWHSNWKNQEGVEHKLRLDSSQETLQTFRFGIANDRFVSTTQFAKP